MKTLFKITALMLITSMTLIAQKPTNVEMDELHTIYDKSFTTDAKTILVLDLSNTTAQICKSEDNKVHIKYTKAFKNYKKKLVESSLKSHTISGTKKNNKITFTSKSANSRYYREYQLEQVLIRRLEKIKDTSTAEEPIIKKTIDSVIRQVKLSERTILKDLLGTIKTKPRVQKWKKSDKIQITRMMISIPEHIHVRFTLGNANVEFLDDFSNKTTMNSRNSKLKFKKIGNILNLFDIDNGYFNVEAIEGGSYSFANTRELTIGRVSNSIINSEFTKVEIGEIGKNMEFIDFNSKFIFHNFSDKFEILTMNTEYSEINLFLPRSLEYKLDTYGNNTKHIMDNHVANLSNKNKKTDAKMFELINSDNEDSNYIKINTVNGIIRIAKDVITLGE
tara:strand:+ start:1537 stop:2712 length:1176 start_codon:yes stop_codon:yes gene_type:complete